MINILFLILLFLTTPAMAATYHVQLLGGTGTQCTGLSSANYPGSGSGQTCAFNHPSWAIGGPSTSGVMAAGDTLQFDDVGPYMIGYGMPNATCSTGNTYDCFLDDVVAGSDSSHRTKIYGVNHGNPDGAKTQLWGTERVYQVLSIGGSHIDLQSLEITDHSSCIENGPLDGDEGAFPVQCVRDSYPHGPWAETGIASNSASTDILLTDVSIHGLAKRGIFAYHNGDWTLTRVDINANSYVGWDSDGSGDDSYTGTTMFDQVNLKYSGCGEKYPLDNEDINSLDNLHHCWSQSQGGYGDGIGLGDGDPGNWTFLDSNISHNVSDGVDLYHGSGTGAIVFARSLTEGNAGNQIKVTGTTNFIDNSIVNGNCYFFHGQAFTSTKSNDGSSVAFDDCRATGNAIVFGISTNNQVMRINNSTVISNGDNLVISTGSGCGMSTKLYAYNDIFLAGDDATGGGLSDIYYASGNDGSGGGSCGSLAFTEDYNQFYGNKNGGSNTNITGAHSRYGTPILAGQSTLKMNVSPYYQENNLVPLVDLSVDSPSRYAVSGDDSADESITLSSYGSNDYNDLSRGAHWDGGSLQYGSTPPPTFPNAWYGTLHGGT